jgi:hypothetical protein
LEVLPAGCRLGLLRHDKCSALESAREQREWCGGDQRSGWCQQVQRRWTGLVDRAEISRPLPGQRGRLSKAGAMCGSECRYRGLEKCWEEEEPAGGCRQGTRAAENRERAAQPRPPLLRQRERVLQAMRTAGGLRQREELERGTLDRVEETSVRASTTGLATRAGRLGG